MPCGRSVRSTLRLLGPGLGNERRRAKYGSEDRYINTDGQLIGHVGLIAATTFIDATASQFPPIRNNCGIRPMITVDPHLRRAAGAFKIAIQLGTSMTNLALYELELAAHNLLLSFGAVLAAMDDERVQVIESCPLLGLAELVKDSRGMDINTSSRRWTPMPSAEGSGTQP